MDEPGNTTDDALTTRPRRVWWIAAVSVAAVLAVGGIVWAVAHTDTTPSATQPGTTGPSMTTPADPSASTSASQEPDATPTDATAETPTTPAQETPTATAQGDPTTPDPTDPPKDLLSDRVTDVLTRAADVLATPDPAATPDDADLEQVAGGTYLAAIRAAAVEYADLGWRQTGTPRVDSLEIVEEDLTGTPPTVIAEACIDSSDVDVVDEGGSLRGAGTPDRSLNLLTFELADNTWRVVAQSFPADPNC